MIYALFYNGIAGWIVEYDSLKDISKEDMKDYISCYSSREQAREVRDIYCHISSKKLSDVI